MIPAMSTVTAADLAAVPTGVKMSEIRSALPQLEEACRAKIEVSEAFNDLCKIVASKAGVTPQNLAAYITAVCKDTLEKHEARIEQLSLLFEELK